MTTGTHGVLKLKDDSGSEKKIYLEDGERLAVPELFWKVVRDPKEDSCVAFVSTNDPFLESAPEPLCKDLCSQLGWPELKNDLAKGYVYCCSVAELAKAIPHMPKLKCKGTIKFK